jgi:poly(A) polymerase
MSDAINRIREATRDTEYEGRLYLVGGYLRDRELGLPTGADMDLVLEGDALALADFLYQRRLSDHHPVLYPRFGTAMITVEGSRVELISARAESYLPNSRKPIVHRSSLKDDALRRDFTINTLMENLHTGERLDLTGMGLSDLAAGIIRTPLDPMVTFYDDPLRMLRAVRFAVRFGFEIEEKTWAAIQQEAHRLNIMGPERPVVSAERIRDEFVRMMLSHDPALCLQRLREGNLLQQFMPELLEMVGVTQNSWHNDDVWDHTLQALRCLPPDASLELRLGLLLHDVGKPATRSENDEGIRFYQHALVGEEIARRVLTRLRFPNDQIRDVCALVRLHMRLSEAQADWSDAAIKRLIRATVPYTQTLFQLAACDQAALRPDAPHNDLTALKRRVEEVNRQLDAAGITSPLSGGEIMQLLRIEPGPRVKEAKEFLTNAVIDGLLGPEDREKARLMLLEWAASRQ